MPSRITDPVVRNLRQGQTIRDSVTEGFLARRHRSGRTSFEVRVRGKHPLYKVVGNADVLTTTQARDKAKKILAAHTLNEDTRGKGLSVATAWPLWKQWLTNHRRSAGTLKIYQNNIDRMAPDLRRMSLAALSEDRSDFNRWHAACAAKTPAAADASAKTLSALFNWTRKYHDPKLPPLAPTADIDLGEKAPAKRQRTLLADDVKDWWRRVQKLRDPIRRECHLFALLSGLRVESLCQVRWQDRHGNAPLTLHIRKPKGGEKRKFDLPLSRPMLACLERVMAHCAAKARLLAQPNDFIFIGPSGDGPLTGISNDHRITWYRSHDLRRGYASFAKAAGVAEEDISRLLNHRVGLAVTSRYIKAVLLPAQERISQVIVEAIGDASLAPPEPQPWAEA